MVKTIPMGMVNVFLIEENGKSVLVDTGVEEMGLQIYEKVKDKNVQAIVLTHGHQDHAGSAKFLSEKLQVPVAMHKGDYPMISEGIRKDLVIAKRVASFMGHVNDNPALIKPFEVDCFLKEGDTLKQFGVAGKVIELPGHTKGSIGILTEEGLITGDTMTNMGQPDKAVLWEEEEEMKRSFEKIKKLHPPFFFVSHGEGFPYEAIL